MDYDDHNALQTQKGNSVLFDKYSDRATNEYVSNQFSVSAMAAMRSRLSMEWVARKVDLQTARISSNYTAKMGLTWGQMNSWSGSLDAELAVPAQTESWAFARARARP